MVTTTNALLFGTTVQLWSLLQNLYVPTGNTTVQRALYANSISTVTTQIELLPGARSPWLDSISSYVQNVSSISGLETVYLTLLNACATNMSCTADIGNAANTWYNYAPKTSLKAPASSPIYFYDVGSKNLSMPSSTTIDSFINGTYDLRQASRRSAMAEYISRDAIFLVVDPLHHPISEIHSPDSVSTLPSSTPSSSPAHLSSTPRAASTVGVLPHVSIPLTRVTPKPTPPKGGVISKRKRASGMKPRRFIRPPKGVHLGPDPFDSPKVPTSNDTNIPPIKPRSADSIHPRNFIKPPKGVHLGPDPFDSGSDLKPEPASNSTSTSSVKPRRSTKIHRRKFIQPPKGVHLGPDPFVVGQGDQPGLPHNSTTTTLPVIPHPHPILPRAKRNLQRKDVPVAPVEGDEMTEEEAKANMDELLTELDMFAYSLDATAVIFGASGVMAPAGLFCGLAGLGIQAMVEIQRTQWTVEPVHTGEVTIPTIIIVGCTSGNCNADDEDNVIVLSPMLITGCVTEACLGDQGGPVGGTTGGESGTTGGESGTTGGESGTTGGESGTTGGESGTTGGESGTTGGESGTTGGESGTTGGESGTTGGESGTTGGESGTTGGESGTTGGESGTTGGESGTTGGESGTTGAGEGVGEGVGEGLGEGDGEGAGAGGGAGNDHGRDGGGHDGDANIQ